MGSLDDRMVGRVRSRHCQRHDPGTHLQGPRRRSQAHYLSTLILIVLLALYFLWLEHRWPIPSLKTALKIGFTWAVLTASFDFGFGHYVDGKSWTELAKDYDITAGRVWIAVLAWIVVGPAVVRKIHHGSDS
jgi:hypothetical protein